ncbi:1-acyl-sn-glycerol-3-phosphate acyltransferase gamma-like [Acanthaster planci]|uniref:1-acyl-sn-glycerol-3-phosphate acyltransferase gamma-like n=1 Tax=Acanthaster planci TaxID=133434 RepID=A0A8B7XP52_ACAPL|nr:1-acyl-sn-glycerol-3-phosphate acyltransferase gamma-like [Acanthaster planci]XP_022081946.1 1-acyl-sn-glycerol-3-phosphate acyltransferase gamma-like [Acanthaster planci]XP_022081947.1 1-acyl-sn-glycerol-3-phosphate acyltransferase gamma-like [Acanthaster planci]XP_022081948.1 1-acyl-sn-glycerol-3-phosphate acyltransferase gamma-like [Acanthaster planci]XP_022081950.1 1-acyl-sn-glycerol-3-phosphate acyltransferase gamma-like [Acanthaster planci]XP_022081951.1 1-acyl-sn-glycerol-3-phosphate
MGLASSFKGSPLVQMVLCVTFIISGVLVILMQLAALVVIRPFNKRLYRVIVCNVVYLHWGQLIWLCDHWSGTEVRIFADEEFRKICGKEHCVMIANHRNDVDWLAIWVIADRFGILQQAKCLMKNELKYVPLVGWSFAMLEMIFVKRDFARDKETMINGFRNYITYPLKCMILLFCEGTRFTQEKHTKGLAFAKEKGLKQLKHHLMPRTKGFVVAMEAFDGQVPAVYDLTFGVSQTDSKPTLVNLLRGKKFVFNFHAVRIPIADVPKTEEEQVKFIYNLYEKKDELYEHFLEHDTFTGYDHRSGFVMPKRWGPLIVEVFWLLVLGLPTLYQLLKILTTGSAVATATALGIVVVLYFLIKYMIGATVTAKGSEYGGNKHRNKIQNGNNSTSDGKSD